MHTIKLARARRLSSTGNYPATYDALMEHLPPCVISKLTAREIATMMDALYSATAEAKALQDRANCDQGAVWDSRRQQLISLAAI